MYRITCRFEPNTQLLNGRSGQYRVLRSYPLVNYTKLVYVAFGCMYAVSDRQFPIGSIVNPTKELKKIIQPKIDHRLEPENTKSYYIGLQQ